MRRAVCALAVVVPAIFSACASDPVMKPFSTDACSMFPDRSPLGKADWCRCCLAHDLAYWRGGTADERLKADLGLKRCVLSATGSGKLADLIFAGVRTGGGPYFFTPYRWGYGWSFGRMYKRLSAAEEAQASSQREDYLATNPGLVCPESTH